MSAAREEERGGLEERLERLERRLEEMKRQLEDIALDEMSEAHAYAEMAKMCGDDEARWMLLLIALDSLVHREIAWALNRAISEAQVLIREVKAHKRVSADKGRVAELVKIHRSIEEFAESSYRGLTELAEPGTTLRKLLELLAEEEVKHERLVEATLRRLTSGGDGGC